MRLMPMDMSVSWAMPTVDDFMVRCGKLNEYILDTNVSLHSIVYVRDSLTKSQQIEFYLLPFDRQLSHTDTSAVDNGKDPSQQGMPQSFCSQEADESLDFSIGSFNSPLTVCIFSRFAHPFYPTCRCT